jgi:hypothetical protein
MLPEGCKGKPSLENICDLKDLVGNNITTELNSNHKNQDLGVIVTQGSCVIVEFTVSFQSPGVWCSYTGTLWLGIHPESVLSPGPPG